MNKIIFLGILLLCIIIGMKWFILRAFQKYPVTIVAYTQFDDVDNILYVNGIEQVGDSICKIIRHEKEVVISIKNNDKEEKVIIQNKSKFNISEPIGDNLGLAVLQVNDKPELREQFGCER